MKGNDTLTPSDCVSDSIFYPFGQPILSIPGRTFRDCGVRNLNSRRRRRTHGQRNSFAEPVASVELEVGAWHLEFPEAIERGGSDTRTWQIPESL